MKQSQWSYSIIHQNMSSLLRILQWLPLQKPLQWLALTWSLSFESSSHTFPATLASLLFFECAKHSPAPSTQVLLVSLLHRTLPYTFGSFLYLFWIFIQMLLQWDLSWPLYLNILHPSSTLAFLLFCFIFFYITYCCIVLICLPHQRLSM